jgi:esterase/lipase
MKITVTKQDNWRYFRNLLVTAFIALAFAFYPSKNNAAIIVVHAYNGNRTGGIYHAGMLARHGYGVLLFDLRAHGESGGNTFAFGWDADQDVFAAAALGYLQNRPDVNPEHIGALGLSVGGEIVLQTAANTSQLKAVVAEGSGSRMPKEWLLAPTSPGLVLTPGMWVFYKAGEWMSSVSPTSPLTDLIPKISPTPIFLISAGRDNPINQIYYDVAQEPKMLWARPQEGHIDALFAQPQEYEEKVIDFFNQVLLENR